MRWNLGVVALTSSWGFVWIIADHLQLGAISIVFWRIGLSALALGLGAVVSGRTDLLRIGRRTWRWTLLLGPLLALQWFCNFEAMKLSSVAVGVLTTYTAPIFLALLAPLFLPERLSRVVLFALPVALTGLALIAFAKGSTHARPLAIAVGVSGAIVIAVLVIMQKRIVRTVNPLGLAFWIDLFAVLALVPVLPLAGRVLPSPGELGYLALIGVVYTALSGLIWLTLLRHVTAQAMGFLSYFEPVSASLLAWLILGQPLGLAVVLGGVIVLVAGAVVVLREPTESAIGEVTGLPQPGDQPPNFLSTAGE